MKLLRVGPPGEERPCVLLGGVVRDVSEHAPDCDGAFFAAGGVADLHRLGSQRQRCRRAAV